MSITFIGTIDISSTTFSDADTNEDNNEVVYVEKGGNTLVGYDLSTLVQTCCTTSLTTTPAAVTIINSASAAVGLSNSSIDLVELHSGYKQNYSGATSMSTLNEWSCRAATDKDNLISLFCSSSSRTLSKFDANTFTASSITINAPVNSYFFSIINIGNDRFIVGTDGRNLFEIDSSGNFYKSMFLEDIRLASNIHINQLSYYNGFLLVSAGQDCGLVVLIDWTTRTILHRQGSTSTGNLGVTLSNSASGVVIAAKSNTVSSFSGNTIYEMTINQGFKANNFLYNNNTGAITATGINSLTNYCWAIQETIDDIRVFTIDAPSTTQKTISSPNGEDFRVLILDISSSPAEVIVDTYTTSPRTLDIPTGKTILETIKIGTGTNATWSSSKYTT